MPQQQFLIEDLMQTDSMDDWQEFIELYEGNEKMRIVANVGTKASIIEGSLHAGCQEV